MNRLLTNRPRVAFFTDSFHEVNGVALTSREFTAFAQAHALPFLSVHAGPRDGRFREGSVTTIEFQRSAARVNLERDLGFDLLFLRHRERLLAELTAFQPDLVHVTGPGDAGILGALLAKTLKVPLAASWHTNLHEFGARRLTRVLDCLPDSMGVRVSAFVESTLLALALRFYELANVSFAPNPELVEMVRRWTGRPTFLMARGIDTTMFSPAKRERSDREFVMGYVGRLSLEKDVAMLAEVEKRLLAAGERNFRFLIVGEGSERARLQRAMQRAVLPGVLRGEELARAYASMDVFLFPSTTDTFGNVILEAMASGVPAIVTPCGGPKYLVTSGVNGFVARGAEEFAARALDLTYEPGRLEEMRLEARRTAELFRWDAVFERVLRGYGTCLTSSPCNGGPQEQPEVFLPMPVLQTWAPKRYEKRLSLE